MGFLKKRKDNGPPDVGKEEEVEYKEDSSDNSYVPIAQPYQKISDKPNFRDNEVKKNFQSFQQSASNMSSIFNHKGDFEIEKLNARLEVINSLITAFNERFSRVNQQIGEIRAMSIANEKNLSLSNLDAKRVVDIVKEVNPEKLRVDYQKTDIEISTLAEKIESYKQYMDSIMGELKDLKRRANLFEGTDALLKLDEDVKKDLIQIQKVNARVKMNADKSEQIFIELSKGFNENRKINETMINLDNSYSGLKKEVEKLNIDYKQILDVDDFGDFKKKIKSKLMMLENSFSEIEKIRDANDKLSKGMGKLFLMEKRNEEDIASLAMKKGNSDIQGAGDYEQKLFSLLEIIEKMTLEMSKIKEKLGIKIDVSGFSEETNIPQTEIGEGSPIARNESERWGIENERRINEMLASGKNYLANGDLNRAWEIYKDISNLYNPAEDNNRAVYSKIINFYNALADSANKPAVSFQPSEQQLNPADFPPTGNRKYKQLGNY